MTLKEAAQQLGRSEMTLYKNFKRTQKTLLKKGIILTRWGQDDYEIEYEETDDESYLKRKAISQERKQLLKRLRELEEEQGDE